MSEWQRVVPPVARAVIRAVMSTTVNSDARTCAARDDHAKDHGVSHTCTVNGLGSCEAIGIVDHANRPIDHPLQICFNRLAVDPRRAATLAETADGLK